ncbi:MAG: CHASE2 domain-containing protein [Paludibacteraceae bacterium]|nr:CHASE2 domain-containing protein [Paludibacteraceae bacterium]
MAKYWTKILLQSLIITLIAWGLTYLIKYDVTSLSAFAPMEKSNSFEMSDMYVTVADRQSQHKLDDNILLVSVDNCSRQKVVECLQTIQAYSPLCIGLDVIFPWETDNDDELLNILAAGNVVLSTMLEYNEETCNFSWQQCSFFDSWFMPQDFGSVNLAINNQQEVIRTFRPFFPLTNGDTIASMAARLALWKDYDAYVLLKNRNNTHEIIDFACKEFFTINADMLLSDSTDSEYLEDAITGKIVLVGDIENKNDTYLCPLKQTSSGLQIHACSLSTILSYDYIKQSSTFANWFWAFLICFIVAVVNCWAKEKWDDVQNLLSRLIQILTLFLICFAGCLMFAYVHYYYDCSNLLLMVGLGSLAFDLTYGTIYVIRKMNNKRVKTK